MSRLQTQRKWCDEAQVILRERLKSVLNESEDLDELLRLPKEGLEEERKSVGKRMEKLLDRHVCGGLIGKGAFGATYSFQPAERTEATRPSAKKSIALKLPMAGGLMEAEAQRNLDEEANKYEAIGPHPNIVRCYGKLKVGEKGREGLAMQLVEGGELGDSFDDLNAKLKANLITKQEFDGAVAYLIRGVLKGLKHMHDAGYMHRDIKPENVMIDSETLQPVIIDIGGAKRLDEDLMDANDGTKGYTDWQSLDGTADMLAVGSTVFEAKEDIKYADHQGEQGQDATMAMGRGEALLQLRDSEELREMEAAPLRKRPAGKVRALQHAQPEQARALAYPDFLKKTMAKFGERIDVAAALDHDFLKDSAVSDERARELLGGTLAGREGREERYTKCEEQLEKLKPEALRKDAEGLKTWVSDRRVTVLEACRKSYPDLGQRDEDFSVLTVALTDDRQSLQVIEKRTAEFRTLVRQLVGDRKRGSSRSERVAQEKEEGELLKAVADVEKYNSAIRQVLGECAQMLRAAHDGSWGETYGGDKEELRQQVRETNLMNGTALEEFPKFVKLSEKRLRELKKLKMDPAAARSFAEERLRDLEHLAEITELADLKSRRELLERVHKRAQLDDELAKDADVLKLEVDARDIGSYLQRWEAALVESRIVLSRQYDADPTKVWEKSAKWFLAETLDEMRRDWLDLVKRTNFELTELPDAKSPRVAQNAVRAAKLLQARQIGVANASKLETLVEKTRVLAEERLSILIEGQKAIDNTVAVFDLYDQQISQVSELQKQLKSIDVRLRSPSDVEGILQKTVNQWREKWRSVLDDCKQGLASRNAKAGKAHEQKDRMHFAAEKWTKHIKRLRAEAGELLKQVKVGGDPEELKKLKEKHAELEQRADQFRQRQAELQEDAVKLRLLSKLPKESDPELDRKKCKKRAGCLEKLPKFFSKAEKVLRAVDEELGSAS